MIELTRLNGTHFFLNPDMMLTVESKPDTTIRCINGELLVVQETAAQVALRFSQYKREIVPLLLAKTPESAP
jgi:flagellar protein FlbD